jgi:hypothetical protein
MNPAASAEDRIRWFSLACALLFPSGFAGAQGILFTQAPRNLELFARDGQDAARVTFAGAVTAPGHDSVRLEIDRDGAPFTIVRAGLSYEGGRAPFQLSGRIHAELAEYAARFYLDDSLASARDSLVCGDVFLIDGQSNAQAQGQGTATQRSEWFRSFGTSAPDAQSCRSDTTWGLAQGSVTYAHGAVGVWGLYLGLGLVQRYQMPMAILNGAVGGTQILLHLRDDAHPMNLNTIYGRLLWRATEAGIAGNVRAILWHQGEYDCSDATWPYYRQRFGTLWNAWHTDYRSLERVYGFQIRPGCIGADQCQLREVQRTLPQYFPGLVYQCSGGISGHDGCHYSDAGYQQMAGWILPLVTRDLYSSADTLWIRPPNVLEADYGNTQHSEIRVRFDSEVIWPADTLGVPMKDYFFLDHQWRQVASGRVDPDGRTVILTLSGPSSASLIGYLPNFQYYGPPWYAFEGPWIRNPRGVAAFSFWDLSIGDPADVSDRQVRAPERLRFIESIPNPFTGSAQIRFSLAVPQPVRIDLYDAAGRRIRILADGWFPAGSQVIQWDGSDGAGSPAASGAYLVLIRGRESACRGRLTLIR